MEAGKVHACFMEESSLARKHPFISFLFMGNLTLPFTEEKGFV